MKTTNSRNKNLRWYSGLLLIILLAAGLRLFRLNYSPLRGDEAFTVRYWAAPFSDVLALAHTEPHPFGAFFAFGLWKALAGETEFAMRALPALFNLIGIPAIAGLAMRLYRRRDVAIIAALLWAFNPFLIWHAQDVRNYAIWVALSVLSFYTLVRAAEINRPRAWVIYTVCTAASLYFFYFEAFFTLVGGVYILLWQRERLKQWILSVLALAVLLIPWLYQAVLLATSGYKGAAGRVNLPDLWQKWLPTLIMGEAVPPFFNLWALLLILVISGWMLKPRIGLVLLSLFLIPVLLVTLASTRMNLFLPRYIFATLPALLLPIALLFVTVWKSRLGKLLIVLFAIFTIGIPLEEYWFGNYHKAPDWYALRDYLGAHTKPGDVIVLNTEAPIDGTADPAFGYYYHPADRTILTLPNDSTDKILQEWNARPASLWFVPSGNYAKEVDQSIRKLYSPISDRGVGRGWIVREFRPPRVWQNEIAHPLQATIIDARLNGFNIDQTESQLTVLLYWEKPPTFTCSVQLIGAANPANNGSPLWSQDDHPPTALRDVYTLPTLNLPVGSYQLQVVAYDPANPSLRFKWNTGLENLLLMDINRPLTPNR